MILFNLPPPNKKDHPTTAFGTKMKEQVEERLNFFANGSAPRKNKEVMKEASKLAMREAKEADEQAAAASSKKSKKDKKKKDKKRKEREEEAAAAAAAEEERRAAAAADDRRVDG